MNMSEMFLDTTSRKIRRCMDKLIGKVILAKPVIDKLKIPSIIEKVMQETSTKHEKVSNGTIGAIMTLNRLAAPMPMYNIEKWVDQDTCVGNIYDLESGTLNDDRIGDFLDEIHPHIKEAWNEIISTAISQYNLPFKIIYNDITSSYFEGVYAESALADFGYSRDQKPDKKQINIDIDANGTGIPLVYKILSGETADKATVINNMEDIIKTLKQDKLKGSSPLVVGDRAMQNNKIIIAYSKRKDLDYLGALKLTKELKKLVSTVKDAEYELIDTKNDNGLYSGYVTEWTFKDKGYSVTDKILLVRSEQKLLNDRAQRKRVTDNFIEALDDLKSKLNVRKYKKLKNVETRITTLRKQYKGSKYVISTLSVDEFGKISLEYSIDQAIVSEEMLLDGKYILATSRKDLSPKEMIEIYKGRDISEKDFAILKGPLQIRPIFLHKDKRIESLIFIIMCALLVYSIIKMEIAEKELGMSINKVMDEFKYLNVRYYEFVDGSRLRITGDLREFQESIITKLEFPVPADYINSIL